jgi:hypothetical protein
VRYYIPIYLIVDVPTPQAAVGAKQSVEQLLSNPMLTGMLQANGVPVQTVTVADPTPVVGPAALKK